LVNLNPIEIVLTWYENILYFFKNTTTNWNLVSN